MSKHIFYIFLFISGIRLTYKFVILDIRTNKIIFLVFLKCRPSSLGFHKPVIKAKNICKYINKTTFLIFVFKDVKSCLVFFLCKYDFLYIFERFGH